MTTDKSSPKTPTCVRCGRTYDGSGDWNINYRHGVTVGYLCPDDQTPGDNAEAVINEATGAGTVHEVQPGSPEHAEAVVQHVYAMTQEVLREFLERVVNSAFGMALDPHALADQAVERISGTIGDGGNPEGLRRVVQEMLQEMLDEMHGGESS
ncbi:hypothetical protein [Ornithinimicrobium cryptoxanthini]|uniref:hypothetical protein n=1 Tax=Ornithinimicrobium cryptoxanthini TaxID=2934161 RepID=UPI0021195176|nr:hypothetical protein [Ornithinimicrobium cryptoxanthini]